MKGKFIVFEGMDGSGTTTQASLLAEYLFNVDKNNDVLLTRNPTNHSPYGKELRRRLSGMLLEGEEVIHDPEHWEDLFINDRRWHNIHYILPALDKGQQVICDRYRMSTIAYQSVKQENMETLIIKQSDLRNPDITFLLDLSPEICMLRRADDKNPEYFERLDFQKKVQEQYLKATEKMKESDNVVIIEGSQSIDDVALLVQKEINLLYGYDLKKVA